MLRKLARLTIDTEVLKTFVAFDVYLNRFGSSFQETIKLPKFLKIKVYFKEFIYKIKLVKFLDFYYIFFSFNYKYLR